MTFGERSGGLGKHSPAGFPPRCFKLLMVEKTRLFSSKDPLLLRAVSSEIPTVKLMAHALLEARAARIENGVRPSNRMNSHPFHSNMPAATGRRQR